VGFVSPLFPTLQVVGGQLSSCDWIKILFYHTSENPRQSSTYIHNENRNEKETEKETDKKASVGSNQETGQMMCRKCGKLFAKTGKFQTLCPLCWLYSMRDAHKKSNETRLKQKKDRLKLIEDAKK
jgi:hypothetical protein